MKRTKILACAFVAFSFLLCSQPVLSAMWFDIRGPYGAMGATTSVGSLQIDESTCSGDMCGFVGSAFSSPPFASFSFNFSIPGSGPTYTSADLISASYHVNSAGQLDLFYGDLTGSQQIDTDVLNGIYTIAGFNVQYEPTAAPASVVPLPATLPLYGFALTISAMFVWRKRRKVSSC